MNINLLFYHRVFNLTFEIFFLENSNLRNHIFEAQIFLLLSDRRQRYNLKIYRTQRLARIIFFYNVIIIYNVINFHVLNIAFTIGVHLTDHPMDNNNMYAICSSGCVCVRRTMTGDTVLLCRHQDNTAASRLISGDILLRAAYRRRVH